MDNSLYLWTGIATLVVYPLFVAIWRLYFSPIAHFPGPRIAALTSLYEAYHNIWRGGKYIYEIKEMHEKYGPIVRTSPTALHVNDPDFYDTVFPGAAEKRRANKVDKFFGLEDGVFSTLDHNVHRMRRYALLPYFSTAYTRKLQSEYQGRIDVLLERMVGFRDTDEPLNANCMFCALTNDMMHSLSFGRNFHKTETPTFDSTERDASLSGALAYHVLKRVLWFNKVLMAIPEPILQVLSPSMCSYTRQKRMTREMVAELAAGPEVDISGESVVPVFKALLRTPKLPAEEKSVERLAQDAQTLLMAGTLSTASTLEHLMYWMVTNPEVLQTLKAELLTVMPSIEDVGKVPLATLEGLPYLTAVIKEGTRLIYGNSNPQLRINPDGPLVYEDKRAKGGGKKWVIPAGTTVGMTSVLLHHNESTFPDSHRFDPTRWLGEEGKRLDKYMVSFGKGGRICLGMNQANGIMRLVMAQIWRLWASPGARIGDELGVLSLHETSPKDVEMKGDYFIAIYNKANGVEFKLSSM